MMGLADPRREMWLFDSWQGLPEPGEADVAVHGATVDRQVGTTPTALRSSNCCSGELGLDRQRVHLVQGWFDETLLAARAEIGPIAVLHLDGDWYASIKTCLEMLYDGVAQGGFMIVDDYFHWKGCAQAVDEFLATREPVQIRRVEVAALWQKCF